jgi:hypothetical protein
VQKSKGVSRRVLHGMQTKLMVQVQEGFFRLTPNVRSDIQESFNTDQLRLDLFGAA